MKAIENVLAGLIDYAGLYPPASLDIGAAVGNYARYAGGKHAPALGRFIVDMNRLTELRAIAGSSLHDLRLSVIGPADAAWDSLLSLRDDGFFIEAIEVKTDKTAEIERIVQGLPSGISAYFEVPLHASAAKALDAISAAGARAKLRMGGVVAEAFPTIDAIIDMLRDLSGRSLAFKATAGLHHPVRSRHPFTYAAGSSEGTMHGFVNLVCAAALIHFGGDAHDLLNEENPRAWKVGDDTIAWRSFSWSADQLREVRQRFFISFGSCSFDEPMHDLEALGWL